MPPRPLPASDGIVRTDSPQDLDGRTAALARVAALVALRASPRSYRHGVERALAAGASVDDVVDTLKVVARTVGLARVVSAAPGLSFPLGYDVDNALETLDDARGHASAPSSGPKAPLVEHVEKGERRQEDDRGDAEHHEHGGERGRGRQPEEAVRARGDRGPR
jgi:Carboxymuconolactone decarboxylase family